MHFMNTWDIDEAVLRYHADPVLGPATRMLAAVRDLADERSDGWCYWPKPVRACHQLITLVERADQRWHAQTSWRGSATAPAAVTMAEVKKALGPIKAFCTREHLSYPTVEGLS